MSTIRVLITDDQAVLSAGLRLLLERYADFRVVAIATSTAKALARMSRGGIDVVVYDPAMPGGGIRALRALAASRRAARILVLTQLDHHACVEASLRLGAAGYLTKRARAAELVTALRAVAAGETYVEAALRYRGSSRATRTAPDRLDALSPRELQVLGFVVRGYTNREIGEQLEVSVKTIEGYRARVLQKLGVRTRADLVAYAMLAGLLPTRPALDVEVK